jgi:hypothetical protein
MDEKGHAVQTAQELVAMATQGVKGIAQSMLPFMPHGLLQPELEAAISSATDGPCVAFQPDHLQMIALLARQSVASVRLADLVDAQPLHSLLLRVGCYVPVGNFVAETVVKTLTHDLHPTQRRDQAYATMLTAARHRPQRWPMSDADYAWASRELGHSYASRRVDKRELNLQLQLVNLDAKALDLSELLPAPLDELQEEAPDDVDDESDSADSDQRVLGWAQDASVKVADIRRVLSVDTVIEVSPRRSGL